MSPYSAKDLLDRIIESINEQARQKAKIDAEESIKYLTEELIKTNYMKLNIIEAYRKSNTVTGAYRSKKRVSLRLLNHRLKFQIKLVQQPQFV